MSRRRGAPTPTVRSIGSAPRCCTAGAPGPPRSCTRSEEHTSELQSQSNLVCRLLLEKKKKETLNQPMDRAAIAHPILDGYAAPATLTMGLPRAFQDACLKVTPEMAYPYAVARAKKLR